jgi:hypothetical protein
LARDIRREAVGVWFLDLRDALTIDDLIGATRQDEFYRSTQTSPGAHRCIIQTDDGLQIVLG